MTQKHWDTFPRICFGDLGDAEYAVKDGFLYVVTKYKEFPISINYDPYTQEIIPGSGLYGTMYKFKILKPEEEVDNGWGF